MTQESKTKRRKLKAHDRGEDRHNKGLSLIKKERRLEQEHQAALQAAAEHHREASARRQRKQDFNNQQMALAALEEMTHNLFEAAGIERQRLAQFYVEQEPEPEPRGMEMIPVTIYTTYRVRRANSEETTLVQGTVVLKPMQMPPTIVTFE